MKLTMVDVSRGEKRATSTASRALSAVARRPAQLVCRRHRNPSDEKALAWKVPLPAKAVYLCREFSPAGQELPSKAYQRVNDRPLDFPRIGGGCCRHRAAGGVAGGRLGGHY